ncbi:hypothetical protein HF086_015430 [Spodoptera exigua]|uniref:Ty3 transposon capsid-like protein domain-containing protein n=1 Tax=Spodoptera exigua TaxID=7107 RepID=A0A922MX92_SPOEX|nr:hypothetical protein HF086_015430 [Spodoptera exigua]
MSGLPNQRARSFAQAVSYNGNKDYEHVERFLASAKKYKEMKNLSEIDVVRSLPYILKGDALTWWQGVKDKIFTWKDFESELRKEFAPKKPAYIIYSEIGQLKQQPDELTERFVAKHRALFNQLPDPPLPEETQLDMMYGNLLPKIQEQIPRETIQSFDGLLEAARGIDQQRAKDTAQANVGTEVRAGKKRMRCNFCRMFGHGADVCRKKQRVLTENAANVSKSTSESEAVSAEPTPAPVKTPAVKDSKEDSTSNALKISPRLMIEISIGTAKEMAFIDTGAKTSLASYKLYSYLKNIGFHFQEENTVVTLADGVPRPQNILTGRIPVKLKDRCILTKFMVLPEARDNDTLLGVDFIVDARMILNLPQLAWSFEDEPNVHYDLIQEST